MSRDLLIIHYSQATTQILKKFVYSEIADFEISETHTAEDAIMAVKNKKYAAIICGNELPDLTGVEIHNLCRRNSENHDTPFILITSSPTKQNYEIFQQNDIRHVLAMPFKPIELANELDKACNPRKHRVDERVPMSDAKATITFSDGTISAYVVNISIGGILCDVKFDKNFDSLIGVVNMDLELPKRLLIQKKLLRN